MGIALVVAIILLIFVVSTTDSNSTFQVFYSCKIFDSEGSYWVRRGSQDVVADSPEKAIQIAEERLRIQQEREITDIGHPTTEYSNFLAIQL